MTRLSRLGTFSVALLIAMAGCSASPDESRPSKPHTAGATPNGLPPRPVDLPLNGVDPCRLLTPLQQQQLGIQPALYSDDSDGQGNPDCQWDNAGERPRNGWLVRAFSRRGAEFGLGSETGAQVVTISGFPAVQTSSPMQDRDRHCIMLVDVAAGQSLWVQYSNLPGDYPGINHEKACQLARDAAAMMIENLRTLKR